MYTSLAITIEPKIIFTGKYLQMNADMFLAQ